MPAEIQTVVTGFFRIADQEFPSHAKEGMSIRKSVFALYFDYYYFTENKFYLNQ